MILDVVLHSGRDRSLALFDTGVHELFHLAAVQTDDVVVVLALVQFEYSGRALEMMTAHESVGFELGENSVDSRKSNIFVRLEKVLVDVLCTHMPWRGGAKDLKDLQTRNRYLEACFAQIIRFHWFHARTAPRWRTLRRHQLLSMMPSHYHAG